MTIKTLIAAASIATLAAAPALADTTIEKAPAGANGGVIISLEGDAAEALENFEDNKAPNTLRDDNGEPAEVVGMEKDEPLEGNKAPNEADGGDTIVNAGDGPADQEPLEGNKAPNSTDASDG